MIILYFFNIKIKTKKSSSYCYCSNKLVYKECHDIIFFIAKTRFNSAYIENIWLELVYGKRHDICLFFQRKNKSKKLSLY